MTCMGNGCTNPAEVVLHHGGELVIDTCFACGDKMMRALAAENTIAGGTIEESANGYARWRYQVGRPVSREEAIAVATPDEVTP